jgi:hypothetical protein
MLNDDVKFRINFSSGSHTKVGIVQITTLV